jgi:hypothetical protein
MSFVALCRSSDSPRIRRTRSLRGSKKLIGQKAQVHIDFVKAGTDGMPERTCATVKCVCCPRVLPSSLSCCYVCCFLF